MEPKAVTELYDLGCRQLATPPCHAPTFMKLFYIAKGHFTHETESP